MPYFQDVVDFTLAEARQAASMTTDAPALEAHSLCHHLPQILRNVDMTVKTCDQFPELCNFLLPDDLCHEKPTTSLHGGYFIIRRAVVGYNPLLMRHRLRSELRSLPFSNVETSQRLLDYIRDFAPYTLRCELERVLTEDEMKHVPIDDRMTRLPLGWRHAGILLGLALLEKENEVTGMFKRVWSSESLNEEDMQYSNSDFYYDSHEHAHSLASDKD